VAFPRRLGETHPVIDDHGTANEVTVEAVGLVAELSRDSLGGRVVLERGRDGLFGAQADEGEV
jgi:hypothetical protein